MAILDGLFAAIRHLIFRQVSQELDQVTTPTPTVPPFSKTLIGNVIGGIISLAIFPYLLEVVNASTGSNYALRSPKHSTFKINLYKYGTVKRKKQIFAFVANKRTPLRKLGWQIH